MTYKISASSAKKAKGCLRRWAADKFGGYRGKQIPAMLLGTDTHKCAQEYIQDGTEPDQHTEAGRIFSKGMHLVPDCDWAEKYFKFEFDGVTFHGYIDFGVDGFDSIRGDHKTSSNPKKYGLTVETLPDDPQGVFYAWQAFDEDWLKCTTLQWIYYPTRSGKPYDVKVTVTREETQRRLRNDWLPTAKRMVATAAIFGDEKKASPALLNVIPNDPEHCGGCGLIGPFACDFKDCDIWPRINHD